LDKAKSIIRLDDRSRMSREAHVRFYEGVGVKLPHSTRRHTKFYLKASEESGEQCELFLIFIGTPICCINALPYKRATSRTLHHTSGK